MNSAGEHPDFLSPNNPATVIVFGQNDEPESIVRKLRVGTKEQLFVLAKNYALISPDTPSLRFCTPGWFRFSPQQMMSVQSTDNLLVLCREQIIRRTDHFSGFVRTFIEAYISCMTAQIEKCKASLSKNAESDEVFEYKDWIFSAWLPLPQAKVLLPLNFNDHFPNFAELDVAFWSDGALIGVNIIDGSTPVASKQKKLDYLIQNYPRIYLANIEKEQLKADTFPLDLFPKPFARFWDNLRLPQGPCPPASLIHGNQTN